VNARPGICARSDGVGTDERESASPRQERRSPEAERRRDGRCPDQHEEHASNGSRHEIVSAHDQGPTQEDGACAEHSLKYPQVPFRRLPSE